MTGAKISTQSTWQNVADSFVSFDLPSDANLHLVYTMTASADKVFQSNGMIRTCLSVTMMHSLPHNDCCKILLRVTVMSRCIFLDPTFELKS